MGQDNIRPLGLDIHNPVFLISSIVIFGFVLVALANQEATAEFFGELRPWLTSTFDWFLVLSVDAITFFCLLLIVLPVGSVRIGGKDAKPDYSYAGWIAMMFAAGIGIGLLFFGVLEPVYYNFSEGGNASPLGIDHSVSGNEYIGVVGTIHHWGLEGWAVYAAVGLSLAIFCYNLGLPLTLRSAFYPILGERVWGWWGHMIDTLAVFATLFGLTTSLGLGAQQIAAGLCEIFGIEPSNAVTVWLIIGITLISLILIVNFFVTSSDSGSLVIDTITAGGKMDAPVIQRIFWCTLEGLVAIALLLGGGLAALQGAAVSTGIPFTLVVLIMCYCLWLALRSERAKL